MFLFGESSMIAQLEALQLEEERFHVIELQPYTEEETREYLEQRLEGAGRGIELFTANQISDIHESSEGWPGNINQVARDAMIEAMIASRSAVKRPSMGFNMPKKHVLAISAVVVVAVAAAWLMPGRSKAPTTGAPANEQAQLPLGQGSATNGWCSGRRIRRQHAANAIAVGRQFATGHAGAAGRSGGWHHRGR